MSLPSDSSRGFGDRLAERMAATAPLCVGIDPSLSLLQRWGLPDSPLGVRSFSLAVVDAVADVAAVVKPQSAFFERLGSGGVAVLEDVCRVAKERGLLVLLDAKRGDIGSTCEAYAQAYLSDNSPFALDAMTISPYLGVKALRPLIDVARGAGKGVFVVARSSNPEGIDIQDATTSGVRVVDHVLAEVAAMNRETPGDRAGAVGVVFGATGPTEDHDLAAMGGPILAPGLGAQGASVDDIAARFGGLAGRVLPTASRSVLSEGPSPDALHEAAAGLAASCRQVLA